MTLPDGDAELQLAVSRWSLRAVSTMADTPTSRVYRVERPEGPAVLKILKPYGADEIRGARLMQWYGGDGSAAIFDVAEPMILMEWLDGGPLADMVRNEGRDEDATAILCDVAERLHHVRGPSPTELTPLRAWFETLFRSSPDIWPDAHRPLVARAIGIATALFETTREVIPLHGDFHHDNVMGSSRGWLVIDPKGLIGDAAYDFANVFRNPYGAGELAKQPARIDALADRLSGRLGLDRQRVMQWAAAHSAISGCWDHAAGRPLDWDAIMLPRLLDALDRA